MSGAIITCPECGTRYSVTPQSLGPAGRMVRCARCKTSWFAVAEPAETLMYDPDALFHADNLRDAGVLDARTDDAVEPVPEADAPVMRPTARIGADAMMRDHVDAARLARRRRTIQLIWAVPVLLVVIGAVIAVLNRQDIVNRLPQMASVYKLAGIDVRVGGLDIDPPEARTILVDGVPMIRVDSVVRNLTRETKIVPLIELTLHDANGQGLLQWYVETRPDRIEGQGRLAFTTEIADPPEGAVGLRYRFFEDDKFAQG
ncbi:MJ0042-type zinc finger domain-containing protein [uncultured Algimonas sp.]|uniref:MJ0042-type zinc finger domain-containing protein n=1 Tax=uncultured Algimonas sp. TaxID=1547920 RepID=UPI0026196E3F|nr:MJ0042-type zinc finger domain-containing protein [uncultured Algimonas sp.]